MSEILRPAKPPAYEGQDPFLRAASLWMVQMARDLERHSEKTDRAAQRVYTVTGGTVTTGTSTSTDPVLALLVTDLKGRGILK